MDPAGWLDHLRTDIDRILATPADAFDAPVAACPGWTVADLLGHHAGVFCFATAQLRAEPGSELVPFDPPDETVPPLEMFRLAADALLAELVAVDPAEHRPTWAGAPRSEWYWRRMAQETAIHRFDAQAAHGAADPIGTDLALDGVEEFIDVFLPSARKRGITGTGETVHLHATDDGLAADHGEGAGEWMFTFHPDGVDVTREHGKGDMAGRGTASDLLLFVWNRRPVELTCFGEPDLLTWWPSHVTI